MPKVAREMGVPIGYYLVRETEPGVDIFVV